MKLLNHPNCIKLVETIETKNNIFIVTDLVKNGDLFEYIKERKFLEGKHPLFGSSSRIRSFNYSGITYQSTDLHP